MLDTALQRASGRCNGAGCEQSTTAEQARRTVHGQDRYILQEWRILRNSGGTVGLLVTSSRLGWRYFFILKNTEISKICKKILKTERELS